MAKRPLLYCSFCGKHKDEVKKLIAGPQVFICDECAELACQIAKDECGGPIRSPTSELVRQARERANT